jgi:hypothetical protein
LRVFLADWQPAERNAPMTSFELLAGARQRDWTGLRWPLMGAAVLQCLLALLLNLALRTEPAVPRVLLLTGGLLCAGIAVAIRLSTNGPSAIDRLLGPSRRLLLRGLALLFVLLALTPIAILIATFFDIPSFPWGTGNAVYLSIIVVPLGLLAARRTLRLDRQARSITPQEEAALMVLLAALCCFIACWALYLPNDPDSWNTIRLLLTVFTGVGLVAAPLILASPAVRRWTVSVLLVMHFSGIAIATLSAPPTPFVIGQMWARLYRPYLEFMYLNNAYHFYAPEPGPATYLWCRLIYVDPQDPEGKQVGDWYKVPKMDEKTGRQLHTVALEYQRHLAMIENIVYTDTTPIIDDSTQQVLPYYRLRQNCANTSALVGGPLVVPLVVPFHPLLPITQQYGRPNEAARRLLASYVRHVAKVKAEHPDLPGYELKWIKIYRVRHDIPSTDLYAKLDPPLSANDPVQYRPFYMGRFDLEGKLLDGYDPDGIPRDPFLYWLLPVVRMDTGITKDYSRLHAGDPNWIRLPDTEDWVTEDRARGYLDRENPMAPKFPAAQ